VVDRLIEDYTPAVGAEAVSSLLYILPGLLVRRVCVGGAVFVNDLRTVPYFHYLGFLAVLAGKRDLVLQCFYSTYFILSRCRARRHRVYRGPRRGVKFVVFAEFAIRGFSLPGRDVQILYTIAVVA
jgi:hypothetical protein